MLGCASKTIHSSVPHWCERPGPDDPRSGLIPVLRLAFGLYLQRTAGSKKLGSHGGTRAPISRRKDQRLSPILAVRGG